MTAVEKGLYRDACEAAFEGSDITTSRITPGLVKEMVELLDCASADLEALMVDAPSQQLWHKDIFDRVEKTDVLLARLKPGTDDGN